MLPKDQISTSGPYGRREITSGDIQYGVPTNDFLLGNSCDTCAQKPKSDSFTCNKTPLILTQNFNKMCRLQAGKKISASDHRTKSEQVLRTCYIGC